MDTIDKSFSELLAAYRDGDGTAWSTLVKLVYSDLRRVAKTQVGREARLGTMGTTALVNECYLRLVGPASTNVASRTHFLNLASKIMRQVLCDYARERLAQKRGGQDQRDPIESVEIAEQQEAEELLELDDLLRKLDSHDSRAARVFECRFFGGLSEEETAEALDMRLRTVQRDWYQARAWLAAQLRK